MCRSIWCHLISGDKVASPFLVWEARDTFVRRSCVLFWGFPGGASGKETTCQCSRIRDSEFHPWVGKIPWRRVRQCTPIFLPGETHGEGYRVAKSQTQLKWLKTHIHVCIYVYICMCVCVCIYMCMCIYVYVCMCVCVYMYICLHIYTHTHMHVHSQSLQSCLTLCNPMDCSYQAPLSMGFSRQEYWSGLLHPPPGDLPHLGMEL